MNDTTATAGARETWAKAERRPAWPRALRSPLTIALVAYFAIALVLLPGYMSFYYKDEIAYVAAAERYARGDFVNAPNSLWGPLISWLMALAMSLGASSIVAARAVGIFCGAAALWSTRRLAKTLELPDRLQLVLLLTLVPYLVRYALLGATDDLPLTVLLLFYFSIIFDPRYLGRRWSGALCGLLGAFAYFAKGFGLSFFLVHFTICSAVHWIAHRDKQTRRKVVRHFALGLTILAALAAVWVGALYQKYHVVTVGITGKYNYEMRAPGTVDRPATQIGFVAPPPGTTVNIWEDPALFYDIPEARECCLRHWTPLDSGTAFKHQLILFRLNLGRTLMVFVSYSPLTLAVGFAALCYCFAPFWPARRRKDSEPPRLIPSLAEIRCALVEKRRFVPFLCLLTILIYPAPYTLVFSDERFFWPMLILVLALGLYLINLFATEYGISRKGGAWLVGIFAASFLVFPLYKLATGGKDRSSLAAITHQLQQEHLDGIRFASNSDYGASMVVGYYLHAQYYGQARPGMTDEEIARDLKAKGVQYYFAWGTPAVDTPGLTLWRTMRADFRTLAIYRVNG